MTHGLWLRTEATAAADTAAAGSAPQPRPLPCPSDLTDGGHRLRALVQVLRDEHGQLQLLALTCTETPGVPADYNSIGYLVADHLGLELLDWQEVPRVCTDLCAVRGRSPPSASLQRPAERRLSSECRRVCRLYACACVMLDFAFMLRKP